MKQPKILYKGKGEDPKVSVIRHEFVEQLNSKARKTLFEWLEAIEKDAIERTEEPLMTNKELLRKWEEIEYNCFKDWFDTYPNLKHHQVGTAGLSRDIARLIYDKLEEEK